MFQRYNYFKKEARIYKSKERIEVGGDLTHHSNRLLSLDTFRDMTIAGMILVNNPGNWSHVYPPLLHAEWHGITPTDIIFSFFLFILGVSIVFAYSSQMKKNIPDNFTFKLCQGSCNFKIKPACCCSGINAIFNVYKFNAFILKAAIRSIRYEGIGPINQASKLQPHLRSGAGQSFCQAQDVIYFS